MGAKYQIRVFGKEGCDKCHTLNQRLDKLLAKEDYAAFEKLYCDVETLDGLLAFSEAECINPSRIPAMLVTEWDAEAGEFVPLATQQPGAKDSVCKKAKLYQYVGLQTDYSDVGKGIISPKMIQTILAEAQG
ncbi:hypothetical protein PDESU_05953 [Pontiella desulfatans]|uniref:Glutaredoxin domain-containing protein n=1 Tax=Pontiella desulfatans TaxID=2750659 RepID=A0A6C2UCQ6_PONDE|nr:hypothetical protein [Pontiella desulfatans]VGO17357.1 hypothetical protein PDESU_05953 [Pontiella desulfatans]